MAINNKGVFLSAPAKYSTDNILKMDINSPEFKHFLIDLYQNLEVNANHTNKKDSGYYALIEYLNGQLWFAAPGDPDPTKYRAVFRKIVNFGALPNTATKTVAHGIEDINANTTFTRIYATASNTAARSYIPIPYIAPVIGQSINIRADATNVYITTLANYAAYNICYVVLEYIRT